MFMTLCLKYKALNSFTGVLMLMCEVQHQHHSCRTTITGLIADNMEGKRKEKICFLKRGKKILIWILEIYNCFSIDLNDINTYRLLLDFLKYLWGFLKFPILESMIWINVVAVAEFPWNVRRSCIKHWREKKFYWIISFTGYFSYHLFALMKLICLNKRM